MGFQDLKPEFVEKRAHEERYKGAQMLKRLGLEIYPHPYLGFSLAPDLRSETLNTDEEGFRLSDSPLGTVDSPAWVAGGGGGLLLGNSVAIGLGATCDGGSLSSQLAFLTHERWLNLGVIGANSLQELIAAVPYLHAASTVVVVSGLGNYLAMLRTRSEHNAFGPVVYEGTFAKLAQIPLFDLAGLASGEPLAGGENGHKLREIPPEPDLTDALDRVETAARMQLRDLAFVAGAAKEGTRVLFCLQPMATPSRRAITAGERENYDFDAPIFGLLHDIIDDYYDLYGEFLAEGCAELGVDYLKITADQFEGTSFMTNFILNDEGNRQAAEIINRTLESAQPVESVSGRH